MKRLLMLLLMLIVMVSLPSIILGLESAKDLTDDKENEDDLSVQGRGIVEGEKEDVIIIREENDLKNPKKEEVAEGKDVIQDKTNTIKTTIGKEDVKGENFITVTSAENLDIRVQNLPTEWVRNHVTFMLFIEGGVTVEKVIDPNGQEANWRTYSDYSTVTYTVDQNGEYTFIIEDNLGNQIPYTVTVDKIDKTKPELNLTKEENKWTNKPVKITAIAEDSDSGINTIFLNKGIEDKNIVAMQDLLSWHSGKFEKEQNKLMITSNEMNNYGGFYIPYNLLEEGKEYVLSFDVTKLEGDIPIIGGHFTIGSYTNVYIDGEKRDTIRSNNYNDWTGGVLYPNDENKHHVMIKFIVDKPDAHHDKNFYVQPNRQNYEYSYKVKFENIMLSEGNEETPYEPNSKDKITGENPLVFYADNNGVYEFKVYDKAGNETIKSIVVDNIDVEPPQIDININTTETTHEDVIVKIIAIDGLSGVKHIKLPDGTEVNGNTTEYIVKENGIYEFLVEDVAGNIVSEVVEVTNIDKSITIEVPLVNDFGSVGLWEGISKLTTELTTVKITDWRNNDNYWRLMVSASPLQLIDGSYSMGEGYINLGEITNVKRIEGTGSVPTIVNNEQVNIDSGKVTLLEGTQLKGEFEVTFQNEALSVTVDPYEYMKGDYESTLLWEILTAP